MVTVEEIRTGSGPLLTRLDRERAVSVANESPNVALVDDRGRRLLNIKIIRFSREFRAQLDDGTSVIVPIDSVRGFGQFGVRPREVTVEASPILGAEPPPEITVQPRVAAGPPPSQEIVIPAGQQAITPGSSAFRQIGGPLFAPALVSEQLTSAEAFRRIREEEVPTVLGPATAPSPSGFADLLERGRTEVFQSRQFVPGLVGLGVPPSIAPTLAGGQALLVGAGTGALRTVRGVFELPGRFIREPGPTAVGLARGIVELPGEVIRAVRSRDPFQIGLIAGEVGTIARGRVPLRGIRRFRGEPVPREIRLQRIQRRDITGRFGEPVEFTRRVRPVPISVATIERIGLGRVQREIIRRTPDRPTRIAPTEVIREVPIERATTIGDLQGRLGISRSDASKLLKEGEVTTLRQTQFFSNIPVRFVRSRRVSIDPSQTIGFIGRRVIKERRIVGEEIIARERIVTERLRPSDFITRVPRRRRVRPEPTPIRPPGITDFAREVIAGRRRLGRRPPIARPEIEGLPLRREIAIRRPPRETPSQTFVESVAGTVTQVRPRRRRRRRPREIPVQIIGEQIIPTEVRTPAPPRIRDISEPVARADQFIAPTIRPDISPITTITPEITTPIPAQRPVIERRVTPLSGSSLITGQLSRPTESIRSLPEQSFRPTDTQEFITGVIPRQPTNIRERVVPLLGEPTRPTTRRRPPIIPFSPTTRPGRRIFVPEEPLTKTIRVTERTAPRREFRFAPSLVGILSGKRVAEPPPERFTGFGVRFPRETEKKRRRRVRGLLL